MNLKKSYADNRIIFIDILRIFATLAVITIHLIGPKWHLCEVSSFEWNVFNIYDSMLRFAVPIFVMISGTLFLQKNHTIKIIYSKYIFRILTAFLFWSLFYATTFFLFANHTLKNSIISLVTGHYHMWFLFMIIGLYMLIPILKKITTSMKLTRYFLILSLIFSFIIPQTISIINIFSVETSTILNNILDKFSFNLVLGYTGYFVCGYYLNKITINKKWRNIIYILGIINFILTIIMTVWISTKLHTASELFYGYLSINVMFESLSIFVFAKYNLNFSNQKIVKIIRILSKYSFGVYLVHPMVILIMDKIFNVSILSFNPIFSIPIITIIVYVISSSISLLLNNTPILKKYIV